MKATLVPCFLSLSSLLTVTITSLSLFGCSSTPSTPIPSPTLVEATDSTNDIDAGSRDGDPSSPPASSSKVSDAQAADVSVVPAVCHARANLAPMIEEVRVAAKRPSLTGGTIADGVYYRTATIEYTGLGGAVGSTGRTAQQTIVIAAGVAEVVYADDESKDEDRSVFALSTQNAEIVFQRTCPVSASAVVGRVGYTATSSEIRLAEGDDGINVFTRQP